MKKWFFALSLVFVVGRLSAAAEFIKTLPATEFAAAGLAKLTPAELARLEAAVLRFKAGEVAAVEKVAEAKVAAVKEEAATKVAVVTQEAATKVAAAEAKVSNAEATSAGDAKKPGWLRALITLENTAGDPKKDGAIESRIKGDFVGWSGKTKFVLENGQVWQQSAPDDYFTSPAPSPKVKIFPARMGGFWMEVEGVDPLVRVKPFKLN